MQVYTTSEPTVSSPKNSKHLFQISTYIGLSLLAFHAAALLLSLGYSFGLSITRGCLSGKLGWKSDILKFFTSQAGEQLSSLILTAVCEIIAIYFLARLLHFKMKPLFGKPENGPAYAIHGSFWFVGLNYLATIACSILFVLINALTGFFPHSLSFDIPSFTQPIAFVFCALSAVVVAPILEEILFRGLILRSLQKFGNTFAIIVSSVLFGLFHGNLQQTIPVMVASVVLGMVAIRTNSLWPSVIIHSVNNALTLLFQAASEYIPSSLFDIMYLLIMLAILCVGFLLLNKQRGNIKIHDYNFSKLSVGARVSQLITAPSMLILIVIYALQFYATAVF